MSYCKHANALSFESTETVTCKNVDLKVLIEYSYCSDCQSEFITKDQIKRNDCRLKEAKRNLG